MKQGEFLNLYEISYPIIINDLTYNQNMTVIANSTFDAYKQFKSDFKYLNSRINYIVLKAFKEECTINDLRLEFIKWQKRQDKLGIINIPEFKSKLCKNYKE